MKTRRAGLRSELFTVPDIKLQEPSWHDSVPARSAEASGRCDGDLYVAREQEGTLGTAARQRGLVPPLTRSVVAQRCRVRVVSFHEPLPRVVRR